jgi:hypothetical protein
MRIFNSSIARRRWANWMIASVVVLGLGESKLIGLVTFEGLTASSHAAFQSKRAEQKTPRDLNNPSSSLTAREASCGTPRVVESWHRDFLALLLPRSWNNSLCLSVHSYESPRAPPREGLNLSA